MELTITPQEACDRLQAAGFKIGYDKLRIGLQQGIFPFGSTIRTGKGYEYILYRSDLNDFIQAHGGSGESIKC